MRVVRTPGRPVSACAQAAARVSGLELGGLAGSLLAGRLSDALIAEAAPGEGHVGKRLRVVRPPTAGYLLLATCYLPLSTFHLLLATFHFPLSTCHLPLATCHLLLATRYSLLTYHLLRTGGPGLPGRGRAGAVRAVDAAAAVVGAVGVHLHTRLLPLWTAGKKVRKYVLPRKRRACRDVDVARDTVLLE